MGKVIFKLPDLGEGVVEAEIIEWHIKPGDLDELSDLVKEIVRKWMPVPVTSWGSQSGP